MLKDQQERIKALFIEEAREHLTTIEQGLLQLQNTLEDSEQRNELFRAAHSIKGGAAMLGLDSIQRVAHRLEDYFKIFQEFDVEADQNLETLFLRVFDVLQELIDRLHESGLPDEIVEPMMAGLEPVFEEINDRLKRQETSENLATALAVTTGAGKIKAARPQASEEREESALQLIFHSDVTAMLREMLQVLKQPEQASSRKHLQEICRKLMQAGEPFDLRNWCELIEVVKGAIANPDNSHQSLALAVREIKQAQELVLAGEETMIAPSSQLKNLLPRKNSQKLQPVNAGDRLPSPQTFTTPPRMETKPKQTPQKTQNIGTPPISQQASGKNRQFNAPAASFDAGTITSSANQRMEATTKRAEHNGPEVGIAELNSLADLFEGEAPLDTTWETEEVLDPLDRETGAAKNAGDMTQAEAEASLDLLPSDFSDLLYDDLDGSSPAQSDSELDDLNSLFGGALPEEEDLTSSSSGFGSTAGSAEKTYSDDSAAFDLFDEENALPKVKAPSTSGFALERSSREDDLNAFADDNDLDELFAELEEQDAELAKSPSKNAKNSPKMAQPAAGIEENAGDNLEAALFGEDPAQNVQPHAIASPLQPTSPIAGDEWAAMWASSEESGELDFSGSGGGGDLAEIEELALDTTDTSLDFENLFDGEQTSESGHGSAIAAETDDELSDLLAIADTQPATPPSTAARKTQHAQDDEGLLDELLAETESTSLSQPANSEELLELPDTSHGDFEDLFGSPEPDDRPNATTPPPQSPQPNRAENEEWFGIETSPDGLEAAPSGQSQADEFADLLEDFLDGEASDNLPLETEESASLLDVDGSELFDQLDESLPDEESFSFSELTAGAQPDPASVDEMSLSAEGSSDDLEFLLEAAEAAQNRDLSEDLEALFDLQVASEPDESEGSADWSMPPTSDLDLDFGTDNHNPAGDRTSSDEFADLFGTAEPKSEVKDSLEFLETLFDSPEKEEVKSEKTAAKSETPFGRDGKKAADKWAALEALLEEQPGYALAGQYADEAKIFAELEGLLVQAVAGAQSVLTAEPPSAKISSARYEDNDFVELEKLLSVVDAEMSGPKIRPGSAATSKARPKPLDQTMRVPIKQLDNLSNLVGELVVNRNSLEQDQDRLRQFLDNLLHQVTQLSDVGQRMQDLYERSLLEIALLTSRQNRDIGRSFSSNRDSGLASLDALEMDRFTGFHILSQEIIELIVRVRESASDIEFLVDEADQVTRQLRQITTQLQEGLTRARMVSFAQTTDRLYRSVRDVAVKEGKQAELQVEGRDIQIDKMIADQLFTPLNHLVNNAIAHGIESPEVRTAAGKSPVGRLTIRAFHQGNQTVISFSDDGAGIDPERVKAKALEKRLITREQAKNMSRQEVYDLLFEPNFSTKDQANDIAGRGVGLNAVIEKVNEIRGVITTDSTMGKGTTFTIRLPLMLSISKALVCISDRARIAFPMDGVEDMLDVPKDRVQTTPEGQICIPWRDSMLPFRHLRDLLGYNRHLGRGNVYGSNPEDDVISVVVLRSAGNYLALQVDQVLGEQEIVIKQLEGPVPKPVGVAGATVMGDGRIVAIADVLELIDLAAGRLRREAGGDIWNRDTASTPAELPPEKSEPTVLIVDDSITVRELLSMTFNKAGYRVEQARDGQEAWEKLRSGLPCDIVFCDIEMPRMDGLELLSRMQKDPQLTDLPIAMLTSRGADRHRQMAVQLGARGYFTKPYLEEALLEAASRMLKGEVLVTAKAEA